MISTGIPRRGVKNSLMELKIFQMKKAKLRPKRWQWGKELAYTKTKKVKSTIHSVWLVCVCVCARVHKYLKRQSRSTEILRLTFPTKMTIIYLS